MAFYNLTTAHTLYSSYDIYNTSSEIHKLYVVRQTRMYVISLQNLQRRYVTALYTDALKVLSPSHKTSDFYILKMTI